MFSTNGLVDKLSFYEKKKEKKDASEWRFLANETQNLVNQILHDDFQWIR